MDKRLWIPLSVCLVGIPLGIALAQDTGMAPGRPDGPTQAELASPSLEAAAAIVAQAAASADAVAGLINRARSDNDILLAACLEDRHEVLEALVKRAGERLAQMQQAGDEALSLQGFVVLTVFGQRAQMLAAEAADCVGGDGEEPGAASEADPMVLQPADDWEGDPTDALLDEPWLPPTLDVPPMVFDPLRAEPGPASPTY